MEKGMEREVGKRKIVEHRGILEEMSAPIADILKSSGGNGGSEISKRGRESRIEMN
jgi:hypothetical protein